MNADGQILLFVKTITYMTYETNAFNIATRRDNKENIIQRCSLEINLNCSVKQKVFETIASDNRPLWLPVNCQAIAELAVQELDLCTIRTVIRLLT
jgi:hypothetical protein